MFVTKLKMAVLMLFVMSVVAVGGMMAQHLTAAPKRESPRKDEDEPISVKVVKPKAGRLEKSVLRPATVRPYWSAPLNTLVSGIVAKVNVDVGDSVKKGQVLAEIHAPHLAQLTAKAAAALEMAKAQVEEAEARLAIAEAELKAAKDLLAVREEDTKKGTSSAMELLRARSDVAIQTSKVRYARAALRNANANRTMVQAELEVARTQESYSRVCAPFDGRVKRRNVDPGFFVQAGDSKESESLLVVEAIDRLKILVRLPEQYLPFIHDGDPVDFETPIWPGTRINDLKIDRFNLSVDEKDNSALIVIDVTKPRNEKKQYHMFPGMSGSVTFHLRSKAVPNALVVPSKCLRRIDGMMYLYLVRDGKAHLNPVTVSLMDDKNAEIVEGITVSDLVITNELDQLRDSTPVKIDKAP